MREIAAVKIKKAVASLCEQAAYDLPEDVKEALNTALKKETSGLGREILREIIKNATIARKKKLPICQDTGMAVVFVELGQEAIIADGNLYEAINEGISVGYKNLRKSIVAGPFNRINTKDNTPANIHIEIVPGDKIKLIFMPKGGGAENASFLKMLLPTTSKEDAIKIIAQQIIENAAKACPPVILGVGIGGAFDSAAYLAKKSLLRPLKKLHSSHDIAQLEKNLLKLVNDSGVGPMGVGGRTTALAVHIEVAPCHIASLPVAVNFQCHAHRYSEVVL